jgi:hypothetical protein
LLTLLTVERRERACLGAEAYLLLDPETNFLTS